MVRHQHPFFMLLANTQSASVVLHVVANWGTGFVSNVPESGYILNSSCTASSHGMH